MEQTPNLNLPYIMPAQAQKHVTHNEAIRALDAIVQIGLMDRDLSAPPPAPQMATAMSWPQAQPAPGRATTTSSRHFRTVPGRSIRRKKGGLHELPTKMHWSPSMAQRS